MNEGGTGKIEQVVNHSGDNSWVGKLTWLFRLPSYLTIFIVTFISARTRASTFQVILHICVSAIILLSQHK